MSEHDKHFTSMQRCHHCGIVTPMEIVATHQRSKIDEFGHRTGIPKTLFELLSCPVCEEVTLQRFDRRVAHDGVSQDEIHLLYPSQESPPVRVAESFKAAYTTASNFHKIDPVAYGMMLEHLAVIHECNRSKRI